MMVKCEDYVKTFSRIAISIQNSSGKEEILNLIVESAVEAMQAKACCLFLIKSRKDPEGLFYPMAQVGLSDTYIHSGPAKGRDIHTDIVAKGGYLAATDATSDPRLQNHEAKKKEGIASILVVPVIADHDPIGILAIYTSETRIFSEEEIDFARSLAIHSGIAIVRARDQYRNERTLNLLAAVAEHLVSSLDIQKVLHIMTSEITLAFDLLGVTIRLKDEEDSELKLVASYGLSEEYLEKGTIGTDRLSCVLNGGIEVIENIEGSEIEYKVERKKEGIVSMLHLPITVKDDVIGIMGLYDNKIRSIEDNDVRLMSSIARLCGLAIQNASLYLQLKQDKEDLEDDIWGHRSWF